MGRLAFKRYKNGDLWRLVFWPAHKGEARIAALVMGSASAKDRVTFPLDPDVIVNLDETIENLTIDDDVKLWLSELRGAELAALEAKEEERVYLDLEYADNFYDYQTVGSWFLCETKRAILADEPGLGKTLQALAACDLVKAKRVLIISPGDEIPLQWAKHINEWLGDSFCMAAIGNPTKRLKALATMHTCRFTIVTHAMLRPPKPSRLSKDGKRQLKATRGYPELTQQPWDVVIIDEAHKLQGRKSQQSKGTQKLKTEHLFLLTGTPIWNMPDSLWHLLYLINPRKYSSYWRFVESYCKIDLTPWGRKITGPIRHMIPELQKQLAPILLRRKTEECLDLPPVRWEVVAYDLSPALQKIYNQMKYKLQREWEEASKSYATMTAAMADMRILCTAPKKLTPPVDLVSPKIGIIQRIVERHISNGQQVLIFAWHRKVVEAIAHATIEYGSVMVNGDVPQGVRLSRIAAYKEGMASVMVASIGTLGTGVDLYMTGAVIFAERDWSPANNNQAYRRAWRIGQKASIIVYDITARNTIEEDVYYTQEQKSGMHESLLAAEIARKVLQ